MRSILRKIIRVLDGEAAEYGQPERGQSLVELAFFMPILILMIVGLAEMGWYTNNYLIMLEVSRVSARFGTVLTGVNDPLAWERGNVIFEGVDALGNRQTFRVPTRAGTMPPPRATDATASATVRDCFNAEGFYEAIVCLAIDSLEPLEINPEDDPNNQDDIIISVFSTNLIPDQSNSDLTSDEIANLTAIGNNRPFLDAGQEEDFRNNAPLTPYDPGVASVPKADGPQIMVTGRYPAMANECADDHRDPFDIDNNGMLDTFEIDERRRLILEADFDGNGVEDNLLYDDSTNEVQRGFALTGRWGVPDLPGCFGSAWNIRRMEALVNLRGLGLRTNEMEQLPDQQGFVLVELAWNHQLLLDFPGFSPMANILGGEEGAYIQVWAAFPIPSAEFVMNLDQPR